MLYSDKWECVALRQLIAWLEEQPSDEEYRYTAPHNCLLARYFTAAGYVDVSVMPNGFHHGDDRRWQKYPEVLDEVASGGWNTMGAALERARKRLTR